MKTSTKTYTALVVLTLMLTGCGTYNLGYVQKHPYRTTEQQQLDTLLCKDEAHLAANSTERQTAAFLAGMTIIGAPIAMQAEKSKKREVFGSCMHAKGYQVTPGQD